MTVSRVKPRNQLDRPLEEFDFVCRTAREEQLLALAGVRTPRDLLNLKECGLKAINGLGPGFVYRARSFLRELGCKLEKGDAPRSFSVAAPLTASESALVDLIYERVQGTRQRAKRLKKGYLTNSDIVKAGIVALSRMPDTALIAVVNEVGVTPGVLLTAIEFLGKDVLQRPRWRAAFRGAEIEYILSRFNFAQLEQMLRTIKRRWPHTTRSGAVVRRYPSARDLESKAEALLREVFYGEVSEASHEGLRAVRSQGHIRLSFELFGVDDRMPEKVKSGRSLAMTVRGPSRNGAGKNGASA